MNTQIYEEAADWCVEFRTGEPDAAARRAFDAWIRKSPEHLRAYLEITEIWQDAPQVRRENSVAPEVLLREAQSAADNIVSLPDVPRADMQGTAVSAIPSAPARWPGRAHWLAAAACLPLLILGGVASWYLSQRNVYATDIGEQRTVTLLDGSTVELNSRTQIRVAYQKDERRVQLLEGEALFHVTKDPSRPFVVHSAATKIRAVGTQFDVNQKRTATTVTVLEGTVAILPPTPDESAASGVAQVLVTAGQQLTVPSGVAAKPAAVNVDPRSATSWTEHKLVFKSSPLPEVIEEFNRYSRRQLTLRGTDLAGFLVSGTYTTTDPTILVRFLREQPGITVQETATQILISRTP